MALRFLDSFDHYTTNLQKWTATGGSATITSTAKRTGANGLIVTGTSTSAYGSVTKTLSAQDTWFVGVAFQRPTAGFDRACDFIQTLDAGSMQGSLRVNADGTLSVTRNGTVLATSASSLLANIWYFIEFKHVIADSGGVLEGRVNGDVWVTYTGDTKQTANATANQIMLRGPHQNGAGSYYFDDLYILDGTGSVPNNTYWGDTQIEAILPSGAGNYTELTASAGNNYACVDETAPNDDTDYVYSSTVDQRDTYAFGNLSVSSATINGIQVLIRARETVAGGGKVARLYRSGSTDDQGSDKAIGTSYDYLQEIMETDPIAAAAWTASAINGAEFGVRIR